ncbi:hypothetical protein BC830DRAFT_1142890 [Chytriomyces sp. MP71]|nr:hypothetical protein BC830DRAFT_1142890 [Chytriomyces sp. MP71]
MNSIDAIAVDPVSAVANTETTASPELLAEMEELLAIQRVHLKVRENHMNMMKEALEDLGQKRAELITLKEQVAEAVKRNDMDAVSDLHSRVTMLQESQSKYVDMLEASQASGLAAGVGLTEEGTGATQNGHDHDVDDDSEEDNDEEAEEQSSEEMTRFISMNLASLLAEINSIDPSTEESDEACAWVGQQRDMLIDQLEELQLLSSREQEKRRAQIEALHEREKELQKFKDRIEEIQGQVKKEVDQE